jgi:MFS family permease
VIAMPALRAILANGNFRRLFAVRLIGQFSDGMLQAALATFVLFSPEREPDPVRVAAAFTILLLPYSFIGPFAGVFLDRWSRRNVLVRANQLKALLTVPVIALVFAGEDGIVLGVSVLIVLGIGRFILAGLSASLPHVVQGPNLITANALTPTAGTIAAAVGGLVGVGLRAAVGGGDYGSMVVLTGAVIGFLIASAIASTLGVRQLGPDGVGPQDTFRGVLRGLVSGVAVLRATALPRRAIVVVAAHRIVFGALTVGALLLVRNTFHDPADADAALGDFAIITGATAVGAIVGAVLTPGITRRIGAVPWGAIALLVAGVGVGTFLTGALVPAFALILIGSAAVGFAGTAVKICADTLVQRHIDDDHLGRVFALFDMIINVSMVTGITLMAFTAPLSGQATTANALRALLMVGTAFWYQTRSHSAGKP